MKNLLFGLIATVLFAFNGNAQEIKDFSEKAEFKTATIKVKSLNENTSYSYKSLEEFNEGSDLLLNELNFEGHEYSRGEKCEVTIEVSVTVTIGVASVTMTGSVTTTCANALAAARKLKKTLTDAALG